MSHAFTQIETWLRANAAPLVGLLNPPAKKDAIAAFEARQGVIMPPEVRALYLTHDGEADNSDGIFGCMKMLPLWAIEEEIELTGESGIIPLFRSGGGDLYYVKSFDPTRPDHRLFEWWHEDPAEAAVISESVDDFLVEFSRKLHRGQFVYRPDELAALIDCDEL
jgi:cell wall assembly regulator SMI1